MFPIIEKLGGRQAALEALNKRLPIGRGPRTEYAIIKWGTNKEIPIRCRWALEREAEDRGIEWTPDDFRYRPVPKRPFEPRGASAA
jgi:hypothetical protein